MAGKHGRAFAELIKACAEAHGVSDRSVRNWREARDQRWLDFLAARAVAGPDEKIEPIEHPPVPDNMFGTGIRFEIIRLQAECLDLARRVRAAAKLQDIDLEVSISRMLDSKRETLRKLEIDNPDIEAATGDSVKKSVLVQYAAKVLALIRTLPSRIGSIMPDSISAEIRARAAAEIDQLCTLAAEIPLEDATE